MSFLERYQFGEREQVWSELIALGASVRQEPVYPDALAVAHETMQRVRHNVELIAVRLDEIGYEFESPETVVLPPSRDVQVQLRHLESLVGTIPLSLRAWYELVGSVNLNGIQDEWYCNHCEPPFGYFDALWVYPIENAIEECIELARHSAPYRLLIAPDAIHKSGDSGGTPYELNAPDAGADGLLETDYGGLEPHHSSYPYLYRAYFVSYLRECFRWGGFPNLQSLPEAMRPTAHLEYLTEDLLQI